MGASRSARYSSPPAAAHVQPFGTTKVFYGIAAYSQTTGNPVAVVTGGAASVLCSDHVTTYATVLEIDPSNASQVHTAAGGIYPTIGWANGSNAGTNTVIAITLNSPYFAKPAASSPVPFDFPGALVLNQFSDYFVAAGAYTFTQFALGATTVSSSGSITVDIYHNGSDIETLTLAVSTSTASGTLATPITVAAGDTVQAEITAIGATASGLSVTLQ